nr:MAG TPA: hypothetical protein [Caudoviricetes sp.]
MGTVPLLSYNECRGISCFWQFPLHLSSRNGGFIHGLSAY